MIDTSERHFYSTLVMDTTSERNFCLQMRTAPQRERFDPHKARRGFTLRAQNVHRATARAIRPTRCAQRVHFACSKCAPRHSESDLTHPKCAEGSFRVLKMRTAPQRERFDPPKVRKGFALRSQNARRATAISLSQSDALATKPTPSAHRATARAIRPTQSAQRVRFARSKCAPRHSDSNLAESK